MSAEILEFKNKYIVLSAVCNTCETSWTAYLTPSSYNMYINNGKKGICPFCGHTEIGLARILGN